MNVCILENGVWQSLAAVYNNLQFIEVTIYVFKVYCCGSNGVDKYFTCLPSISKPLEF